MNGNKKRKSLVNLLLLILILFILIWLWAEKSEENRITKISASDKANSINIKEHTEEFKDIETNIQNTNVENTNTNANLNTNIEEETELNKNISENKTNNRYQENTIQENTILKEYQGYKVEAKLEIPKISLETYILKEFSSNALNVSVTKFWGADANSVGNLCVAGHNFRNTNMFHDLKKLNIGDKLYITNNTMGKIEYQIYEIDIVLPKNVDCLDQETNGTKQVTLITCTNDSEKRIIVKAKEAI